jgi:hypothetical protein
VGEGFDVGIVMYVFDGRYPIRDVKPGLHGQRTVRKVVVGPSVPIPETVRMIVDAKAGGEKIELLRLCAHGNSGGLILGSGLVPANVEALRPLQLHMDNGAAIRSKKVEIHGCGVASDTSVLKDDADPTHPNLADTLPGSYSGKRDRVGFGGQGYMFLLSVAVCVMAKAEGAVDVQVANNTFRYHGKTVIVDPNGEAQVIDSHSEASEPALVPDPG